MTRRTILQATVRYREGDFELRCERCAAMRKNAYWPLTTEFWDPAAGMNACRACRREVEKQRHRIAYHHDQATKARAVARAREYYRSLNAQERAILVEKKRPAQERWRREQHRISNRESKRRKQAEARAA